MTTRQSVRALASLAAAALLLAGCSASTAPNEASDDGEPVEGGTLAFAQLAQPTALDPQFAWNYADTIIASNIADRLTFQDPATGEVKPWLSTGWTISDDASRYTFDLRDDVSFSDGTALDASVVKANFDLLGLGDDALGVPANTELFSGYVTSNVIDDDTVEVVFDRPNAGFLANTTHPNASILGVSTLALPKEDRGDYRNIVASGPFEITAYEPQLKTVLSRRDDYAWAPQSIANAGGAAHLDTVEINVVAESTSRSGALRAGELDAILDVQPTDEAALESAGFALTSALVPGANLNLSLRTDKTPTDDEAVRRAVQIGWDRQGLVGSVLTESYPYATSVVSSNIAGYVDFGDSVLAYDPDGAQKLLEDAGWVVGGDGIRVKDGQRLVLAVATSNSLVTAKTSLEYVQQQLADIGIELEVNVIPVEEWSASRATPGKWNGVAYNNTSADITVIENVYGPTRSNVSFLSDSDEAYNVLKEQFAELDATTDPVRRAEVARTSQELVLETFVLSVPIFTNAQVVASAPRAHGIDFTALARVSFYNAWVNPEQ